MGKVFASRSINTAFKQLKSILLNTIDRHALLVEKTVKGKPSPWLTKNVKRHMNIRDQLNRKAQKSGNRVDWQNFRRKRNFVINEIKRAKRSYFQNQLKENYNKSDKLWDTIKKVFPIKKTVTSSTKSFKVDDKIISDKPSIAQGFCNYYSTVASKLKQISFPLVNFVWKFERP